ncbi:helix-turn-helix domain-containing protein [Oxalobacter sp. OttesenSCG-928-P03]|nr:helix-turn-helix domain-containing protein [Oxalobacter sp. OttesenSCG-928-P03]
MSRKRTPRKHIFSTRLSEARKQKGLSQKTLGMKAGIDEFVAGTRINRYEKGIHSPDIITSRNIAKVLCLPLAYFFADEDRLAQMIAIFSSLSARKQKEILALTEKLTEPDRR